MIYVYYWIAFMLIIFLVIIFSEVNVDILLLKKENKEEIIINTKLLYGLLKYRLEVPFVDALKKGYIFNDLSFNTDIEINKQEISKDHQEDDITFDEIKDSFRQLKINYIKFKEIISYITSRIKYEKLSWETEVGTGDAAVTAITSGAFWGIKSNIASYFYHKHKLNQVKVNVKPYYQGKIFSTTFNCIFTLKVGYIIIAAIKLLYRKIRGW